MMATPVAAKTHRVILPLSCRQPRQGIRRAQELPTAIGATLELDLALGKPFGPDEDLPGYSDQVGGSEFGPRPLVRVVVEYVYTLGRQVPIELLAGCVSIAAALLEVEDRHPERCDRLRPFDPGIVVEGFDNRADEARDADAVGAAMDRPLGAVRAGHGRLHGHGVLGPEIEDLPDLDAAGMH